MTIATKLTEHDLPQLVNEAVQRAIAARQSVTELSAEQTDLVGGALSLTAPMLQQPVFTLRPGNWAGPLLAPIGQQIQTPQLAGNMLQR